MTVGVALKAALTQSVPGDWCHVSVKKRDPSGALISKTFQYVMENSTGDLYQGSPSRLRIALKSAGIFLITTPYAVCMVAWRCIDFSADIVSLARQSLSQFVSDFQKKGPLIALLNGIITPVCETFRLFADHLSKVVAAPFYALAMECAALYGMVIPYEGMKIIGQIEKAWHGNSSYRSDIRHTWKGTSLLEDVRAARSGKVYYLGYCMQKRGNFHEVIKGNLRFTLIESASS